MSGRQIIGLVLAIVVAYFVVKIVFGILAWAIGAIWFFLGIALVAGVAYLLYNKFTNMLTTGKRLT